MLRLEQQQQGNCTARLKGLSMWHYPFVGGAGYQGLNTGDVE